MDLLEKAKSFPRKPGVYLFKGAKGEVLYVGKAKQLRDRVRSYFQHGKDERPQVEFLVKRARDIEFIITDSEKEALLLENTLIKRHRPRYNLHLKDDKSYVSIRISAEHRFPGISITRKIKKDGAKYFGPYDSSPAAREAIEQITRFFKIRTCRDGEFSNRIRPCLKYDIGRCTAPCVDRISRDDYLNQLEEAMMFLTGRSLDLIRILKQKMSDASGGMRYEDAARFRDAIEMLKGLVEKQKVIRHGGGDHDALGIAAQGDLVTFCILKVRRGLLLERRLFNSGGSASDAARQIEEFLMAHYVEGSDIPSKILMPLKPDGLTSISSILNERRGGGVRLAVPMKGAMRSLVELANTNAAEALTARASTKADEDVLARLARRLDISGGIANIECVDISNLSGREAVGSVVSFMDGRPCKGHYRIYNIRSISTPDDYAMLHEVIRRRFDENVDRALPDLFLVDGGKGQLAVAMRVMSDLSLHIPLAAIAKAKGDKEIDRIFIPGRKNPLNLKKGSKELLLLMRIRDEAHRFGINAHRRKRERVAFKAR